MGTMSNKDRDQGFEGENTTNMQLTNMRLRSNKSKTREEPYWKTTRKIEFGYMTTDRSENALVEEPEFLI